MYLKCYDFSGIRLGIESEILLDDNDRLEKFRFDGEPDYVISLRFVDRKSTRLNSSHTS